MKWLKCCLFLLFLFAGAPVFSEPFFDFFNTDAFWAKLVQDSAGTRPVIGPTDTAIMVASNRARQEGSVRFMSELREDQALRIFLVYTQQGKWHVLQVPSLRAGLPLLPAPDKDWVIYAEGMGKIFTSDLDRGLRMAGSYGVNVLLLDYPSIRSHLNSYRNYRFAIRNARTAYEDFVPVLDSFRSLRQQRLAGTGNLSLFFHSMGNNIMREVVRHHLLFLFNNTVWVDNLILNAPCVPRRGHRKWVDQIHFAKHIYVHFNPGDGTLKWARLAGFHQILGEHLKRPLSRQAFYVNFNPLAGEGHSNFLSLYSRPPLPDPCFQHYGALLHGRMPPLNDVTRYRTGSYRHIGFDILPALGE